VKQLNRRTGVRCAAEDKGWCEVWRPWGAAPAGWSGNRYAEDTSTDTDSRPYCDWLPQGWLTAWREDSCEEMAGVRCDADGNVVELKMSEKGLRGELPAGLAALLPNLREVFLDGKEGFTLHYSPPLVSCLTRAPP